MTSSTREVVTLQLGHYSNFVGTHWWNSQESSFVYNPSQVQDPREINHDVFFREGLNPKGEVTYTPRLVAFDLKGSLNTMRQEGVLYDHTEDGEDIQWGGDVTMHKFSQAHKNDFLRDLDLQDEGNSQSHDLEMETEDRDIAEGDSSSSQDHQDVPPALKTYDLDSEVSVWSDFLRIHLHPRTVHIIDTYQHNSDTEVFDLFHYGSGLKQNHGQRSQIEDRIHFFVEECDHLQGFQILVDINDGFGGLSCELLQELHEDYDTKGILTFGLAPACFPDSKPHQDLHRLVNTVLSLVKMAEHSSSVVPLSLSSHLARPKLPAVTFPYLNYRAELLYHTSAILAASLDTMSLPYRLETAPSFMSHMLDSMAIMGRKVLALYSSLPFPMQAGKGLVSSLMQLQDTLPWQPVSTVPNSLKCYCQAVSVRGVTDSAVTSFRRMDLPQILRDASTVDEVVRIYLSQIFTGMPSAVDCSQMPVKTTVPFPRIFNKSLTEEGSLSSTNRPDYKNVESVPCMTCLQSSEEIGETLQHLYTDIKKVDFNRLHRYEEMGLEEDDFKESINELITIAENYSSNTSGM